MQLPTQFLDSLNNCNGYDAAAFVAVHQSGEQITSIRYNTAKCTIPQGSIQVPWCNSGFYLPQRPSFTFDPLFHAGCYYVQEASSMFIEQAIRQLSTPNKPLRVLDLCAAPGGKSTHLQSLLPAGSLLVSNEVIRARANILKDNIIKWGAGNVMVTNNDPRDFARLENFFDIILVDAPCSGSGLFRRDPSAIEEWSEDNVALCSQRQQRILADVLPALTQNGLLLYSTCSYSAEEDEAIVGWLRESLHMETCSLLLDADWGIISSTEGYRFWPDKVNGEGFFLSCMRKTEGDAYASQKIRQQLDLPARHEIAIAEKWADIKGLKLLKYQQSLYGWPEDIANEMRLVLERMKVIYSGILIGEILRDKLVPDHSLAMSTIINDEVGRIPLSREDAIRYLQRGEFPMPGSGKGWNLATYEGHPLGWMNVLPNRINNYYPKELRILKDN